MSLMESVMQQELLDIALKVGGAWIAGSLIGLERTIHGRPAGFRTHALVCIASALLMLVTSYQWRWFDNAMLESVRTDPTRMAQGIMTGIGFLGGGVIFREGLTVRGLTTAASIWTTAAVGILFGTGLYLPALVGTVLMLGILSAFRWFEELIPSRFYARYSVRFRKELAPSESDLRRLLADHGFGVANVSYSLHEGGSVIEYRTVINTARKANAERLAKHLREEDGVVGFNVSPTGD